MYTPLEQQIHDLAAPVAKDEGLEVVWVKLTGKPKAAGGGGLGAILQILVEDPATSYEAPKGVGVGACAQVSRMLSPMLDVEDIIPYAYTLEVSSAGVERPLVTLADFTKYAGKPIKLQTTAPVDGQKRFEGVVQNVQGESVLFAAKDRQDVLTLDMSHIKKAHLVLTDERLKKMMKGK